MKSLEISITEAKLSTYIQKQVNNFFPDDDVVSNDVITSVLPLVLEKIEKCFSGIVVPYYRKNENPFFNHLHGDHYAQLLYWVSRFLYLKSDISTASKVFMLNKALFGVDAFYEVVLPDYFLFVHPIGTILGRGSYQDYLVVYQGVTVGANSQSVYPSFGKQTILFSNCSVIGSVKTGDNFILGAKASLIDTNIASNSVVVGQYPHHKRLENTKDIIKKYFVNEF
jgi:serine O-acetyltransferase